MQKQSARAPYTFQQKQKICNNNNNNLNVYIKPNKKKTDCSKILKKVMGNIIRKLYIMGLSKDSAVWEVLYINLAHY